MKRSTFLKTLVAAPAAIKVVALGAKPQLGGIPITIEGTGSELIISESKGWQPTKRRGDLIFEYINKPTMNSMTKKTALIQYFDCISSSKLIVNSLSDFFISFSLGLGLGLDIIS